MSKIKISISAFNEVAEALQKEGKQLGVNVITLTIDKGDFLAPDHDLRLASIRGDVVKTAAGVWRDSDTTGFIDFANKLFNFVLKGEIINQPIKSAWKDN